MGFSSSASRLCDVSDGRGVPTMHSCEEVSVESVSGEMERMRRRSRSVAIAANTFGYDVCIVVGKRPMMWPQAHGVLQRNVCPRVKFFALEHSGTMTMCRGLSKLNLTLIAISQAGQDVFRIKSLERRIYN
ncbi:hypothetical protein PHSY_004812 [Pseudozyma hubeiensis SY62]|uniref:Uncharacterized protein n=1 Tax=Pseudozyma hubeiensis (strain SY62) TaxID=1305764 RepID=R9P7J0_PSEHS|nr:hypothetical protein PHSY_004812 [Pseudozyma hubeiensis SY62]GAC97227.1 hypothetical protein PHSY_004812 [Pseudozyma hubeiensis SY62]